MDYYLSFSNNYVAYKEIKLDEEGYNVFQRTIYLGTQRGQYKMGTYRISRGDGWFTDDYTIQVGFGEKLSKFIRDIGYLRKFYYSSSFEDFLKKYPTVEKATSPHDTGFGPGPIFFNSNENVNVYDEYVQFDFELDKEYRNSHEKADKYALEVMRIMEKIVEEVVRMTPLDFSRFSFSPSKSSSSFRIPRWAGGITKIGLKAFANYLGANLPDFDFSSGGDSDFDFSGGGDSGFDFSDGNSDFDFDPDFGDGYDVNFLGKDTLPSGANSDGYIPDGSISLTRTITDKIDTFKHYIKDEHDYVLYNGKYYRVDGYGTVTINGIKYDKK